MDEELEPGECSRSTTPGSASLPSADVGKKAENGEQNASSDMVSCAEAISKRGSYVRLIDMEIENKNDGCDSDVIPIENDASFGEDIFILDTKMMDELVEPAVGKGQDDKGVSKSREKVDSFDFSKVLTFASCASHTEKESTFRGSCFNCGGDHILQNCDAPLDQKRIALNRSSHYNKRTFQERYIDTGSNVDSESNNYVPGYISDSLREALDIGPTDIPEWIYRMRRMGFIFGYPPGYLEEAVAKNTESEGLLEFHTEENSAEQGEKSSSQQSFKNFSLPPKVIPEKIIHYPGFNARDRKLNDRERFIIPSFGQFLNYQQQHVNSMYSDLVTGAFADGGRRRRQMEEVGTKRIKIDHKTEDVITIDDDDSQNSTMGDESTKKRKSDSTDETLVQFDETLEPEIDLSLLGSSLSVQCGTPQVIRQSKIAEKPDLDCFQNGIVPFSASEEPLTNRGFFKKLMEKIKQK